MKKYDSFIEIDKDLKVLRLQKQIALLELQNHTQEIKNNLSQGKHLLHNAYQIWQFMGSTRYKIIGFSSRYIFKKIFHRNKKRQQK